MKWTFPSIPRRLPRPFRALAAAVLCTGLVAGCGGPETMIASSIISAAVRTTIEQAAKNRPTPEQLWHEAQVAQLERRAIAGDVEAQFQIGTYYLVLQEPVSQQWICTAANGGHAKAQLQYGHWFNEDRAREDLFPFINISPDNAMAYMWYDLAAANGEPRAPHFRDNLIYGGMPVAQLDRGRARVANWTPQPCDADPIRTAAVAGDTPPGVNDR